MCEPISIGTAIAISVGVGALSAAPGIMASIQKNKAAEADYRGKLAAQAAAEEQSRADREATHQNLIRKAEESERDFTARTMEATLKAEELRGEALTQGANGGVATAVFDHTDRMIGVKEGQIVTSALWDQQTTARNIKAASESSYRKQSARNWQSLAGRAPVNTVLTDSFGSVMKGASSGLSAFGGMKAGGLIAT